MPDLFWKLQKKEKKNITKMKTQKIAFHTKLELNL